MKGDVFIGENGKFYVDQKLKEGWDFVTLLV